jgi:hypothetical protein
MARFNIRLNSGIVFQGPTKTVTYRNNLSKPYKVGLVQVWGGFSLGSVMDLAIGVYITGVGPTVNVEPDGSASQNEWYTLLSEGLDRCGNGNGGKYSWWHDWNKADILWCPNEDLILQVNCVDHSNNQTFPQFTQGQNNVQAIARIHFRDCT